MEVLAAYLGLLFFVWWDLFGWLMLPMMLYVLALLVRLPLPFPTQLLTLARTNGHSSGLLSARGPAPQLSFDCQHTAHLECVEPCRGHPSTSQSSPP